MKMGVPVCTTSQRTSLSYAALKVNKTRTFDLVLTVSPRRLFKRPARTGVLSFPYEATYCLPNYIVSYLRDGGQSASSPHPGYFYPSLPPLIIRGLARSFTPYRPKREKLAVSLPLGQRGVLFTGLASDAPRAGRVGKKNSAGWGRGAGLYYCCLFVPQLLE